MYLCTQTSEVADLSSELEGDTEMLKIPVDTGIQSDLSASPTGIKVTLVSEERSDPEASIIINITVKDDEAAERETSHLSPEETAESCKDRSTPRKKKRKSKQDFETSTADASITDTPSSIDASTPDPLSDTPLPRKSAKKEKRDKKRQEEEVTEDGGDQEDEVEASQLAPPDKKKKAKKRKRERDEEEEKEEETHTVTENKIKKKKKKKAKDVEEEKREAGRAVEEKAENPVSLAETMEEKKKKKKKKRKEGGQENEAVQSEEQPAGGSNGTEEKMEATGRERERKSLSRKFPVIRH